MNQSELVPSTDELQELLWQDYYDHQDAEIRKDMTHDSLWQEIFCRPAGCLKDGHEDVVNDKFYQTCEVRRFPLLKLPYELRLSIYKYTFRVDRRVPHPLLAVNRTIRQESLPVFLAGVILVIDYTLDGTLRHLLKSYSRIPIRYCPFELEVVEQLVFFDGTGTEYMRLPYRQDLESIKACITQVRLRVHHESDGVTPDSLICLINILPKLPTPSRLPRFKLKLDRRHTPDKNEQAFVQNLKRTMRIETRFALETQGQHYFSDELRAALTSHVQQLQQTLSRYRLRRGWVI